MSDGYPKVMAGMAQPGFNIGRFTLRDGYGGRDKVWIEGGGGEGGDFEAADLEELLAGFYETHF